MKILIFNPEHDIALAAGGGNFTPPHAARALRGDLGFLPALWADDGDIVVVDDVETALTAVRHVRPYSSDVLFVSFEDLMNMDLHVTDNIKIEPWGWDAAIRRRLFAANSSLVPLLPTDRQLEDIRQMSNRRFAAEKLLPYLRTLDKRLVGEGCYAESVDEVEILMKKNKRSVLKAPWSSSGRGIRYVDSELHQPIVGWVANVIAQQGGVMVEPYYNKISDFGMEFRAMNDGSVEYCGLSLFSTGRGGAYEGSIITTENEKRRMLSRLVDLDLVDKVMTGVKDCLGGCLAGKYEGAFGVDMMVVAPDGDLPMTLHPCVELNLRRTMGHLALALTRGDDSPQRIMRICYEGRFRLRINTTGENLLNTSMYVL